MVSLSKERADIVMLPRLADGKILLAAQAARDEGRCCALPILTDHCLDDGWKLPVLKALGARGIATKSNVRPLGVLRVGDHNALVVVIDGCQIVERSQIVAAGMAEFTAMIRAGEINCDATLAAFDLLQTTHAAYPPPPHGPFPAMRN